MGLIYRTDVFKKYGITPPTTWDEYRRRAAKVKAAGGPLFGDLGVNVPAAVHGAADPEGRDALRLRPGQPAGRSTVKLNDQASKDVLDYWADLVEQGSRRHAGPVHDRLHLRRGRRQVRDLRLRRVGSRLPDRRRRRQGRLEGRLGRRPAAAVGRGQPRLGQLGRLGLRGDHPGDGQEAGRRCGQGHLRRPGVARGRLEEADHLPAQQERPDSDEFVEQQDRRSSAARQANKEVYLPAENAYKGFVYAPITTYYYAQLQAELAKINAGKTTGDQAADDLQANIVKYAESQGFTVTSRSCHYACRPPAPGRTGLRTRAPLDQGAAGMAHATAVDVASPATTSRHRPGGAAAAASASALGPAGSSSLPFAVVFLVFLVAPLLYAFYLSLYSKGLATGRRLRRARRTT